MNLYIYLLITCASIKKKITSVSHFVPGKKNKQVLLCWSFKFCLIYFTVTG